MHFAGLGVALVEPHQSLPDAQPGSLFEIADIPRSCSAKSFCSCPFLTIGTVDQLDVVVVKTAFRGLIVPEKA